MVANNANALQRRVARLHYDADLVKPRAAFVAAENMTTTKPPPPVVVQVQPTRKVQLASERSRVPAPIYNGGNNNKLLSSASWLSPAIVAATNNNNDDQQQQQHRADYHHTAATDKLLNRNDHEYFFQDQPDHIYGANNSQESTQLLSNQRHGANNVSSRARPQFKLAHVPPIELSSNSSSPLLMTNNNGDELNWHHMNQAASYHNEANDSTLHHANHSTTSNAQVHFDEEQQQANQDNNNKQRHQWQGATVANETSANKSSAHANRHAPASNNAPAVQYDEPVAPRPALADDDDTQANSFSSSTPPPPQQELQGLHRYATMLGIDEGSEFGSHNNTRTIAARLTPSRSDLHDVDDANWRGASAANKWWPQANDMSFGFNSRLPASSKPNAVVLVDEEQHAFQQQQQQQFNDRGLRDASLAPAAAAAAMFNLASSSQERKPDSLAQSIEFVPLLPTSTRAPSLEHHYNSLLLPQTTQAAALSPNTPNYKFYTPSAHDYYALSERPQQRWHQTNAATPLGPQHQNLFRQQQQPVARIRRPSGGLDRRFKSNASARERTPTVHLGDAAPARASFLRYANPVQYLTGGGGGTRLSPKSLLSALNDKLNNWSDAPQPQQQVLSLPADSKLLESVFYDNNHLMSASSNGRGALRRKPSNYFGTPTRVVWPASAHLPQQVATFYGGNQQQIVRQPTVAPAAGYYAHHLQQQQQQRVFARNKGHFYNVDGGTTTTATQRQRMPTSSKVINKHIQQQGSQQPASFIPVVAVQVTRTSPAPIPMQGQVEQRLVAASDQASEHSAAAEEIDEYLLSKTAGHQQKHHQQQHVTTPNNRHANFYAPTWDDSSSGGHTIGTRPTASGRRGLVAKEKSRPLLVASRNQFPLPPPHETTVKSAAVFGYLPHQVDAPLMHAMNVLQQLPATSAAGQSAPNQLQQLPATSSPDQMYANQMDHSNQAADASYQDHRHLTLNSQHHTNDVAPPSELLFNEQQQQQHQPSLTLQLQANNYVQNDIAHPFGSLIRPSVLHGNSYMASADVPAVQQLTVKPLNNAAHLLQTDQANVEQQQQHYQLLTPIAATTLAAGNADQLLQLTNPLLTANTHHHQFPVSAAAAELSALMTPPAPPGIYFAPASQQALASTYYELMGGKQMQATDYMHATDDNKEQQTEGEGHATSSDKQSVVDATSNTGNGLVADSSTSESSAATDSGTSTPALSHQNKVGQKKRSGEFFASAGHLLLSALPLLLAPTLGLMFASAPAGVRYQSLGATTPVQQASGIFGGGGGASVAGQAAVPFGDGLVLNASPAPQMFTPTPPGANDENYHNNNNAYNTNYNRNTQQQQQALGTASSEPGATHQVLAGSVPPRDVDEFMSTPNNYTSPFKHRGTGVTASLPAMTGLSLNAPESLRRKSSTTPRTPSSSKTTSTSTTTTIRPLGVIITSSAPIANDGTNNKHFFSSSGANDNESLATTTTSITNPATILVFEHDELPDNTTDASSEADVMASGLMQPSRTSNNQHAIDDTSLGMRSHHHFNATPKVVLSTSTTTTRPPSPIVYDVSYEGADFDAQYATLRRHNSNRRPSIESDDHLLNSIAPNRRKHQDERLILVPHRRPAANTNRKRDKIQYASALNDSAILANLYEKYNLLTTTTTSSTTASPWRRQPQSSASRHDHVDNSSSLTHKLYPLSTWPPLRRKAVSLITSSGNRTLYESMPERKAHHNDNDNQRQRAPENATQVTLESDGIVLASGHSHKASTRVKRQATSVMTQAPSSSKRSRARLRKRMKVMQPEQVVAHNNATSDDVPLLVAASNEIKLSNADDGEQHLDGQNNNETMRRDASKSKSAIVTAMITHVSDNNNNNSDDDDDNNNIDDHLLEHNNLLRARDYQDQRHQSGVDELREQLLEKKLLLDRLATRVSSAPGGEFRHRLVHAPKRSSSNKQQLQLLDDAAGEQIDSGNQWRINRRRAPLVNTAEHHHNKLELTEDTERALAKFGSLLLEDTLQVPAELPVASNRGGRKRVDSALNRLKYSALVGHLVPSSRETTAAGYKAAIAQQSETSAATERYATRATQAPATNNNNHHQDQHQHAHDNWSARQYNHYEPNVGLSPTRVAGNEPIESQYYEQPSSGGMRSRRNHTFTLDDHHQHQQVYNHASKAYRAPIGRVRSDGHATDGGVLDTTSGEHTLDGPPELAYDPPARRLPAHDSHDFRGPLRPGNGHVPYPSAVFGTTLAPTLANDLYNNSFAHSHSRVSSSSSGLSQAPDQATSNNQNNSTISRYNNFLMSHFNKSHSEQSPESVAAAAGNFSTSARGAPLPLNGSAAVPGGEQLDARYSTYSTSAPTHTGDQHPYNSYSAYSAYASHNSHDNRYNHNHNHNQYAAGPIRRDVSELDQHAHYHNYSASSYPPPPPPPPHMAYHPPLPHSRYNDEYAPYNRSPGAGRHYNDPPIGAEHYHSGPVNFNGLPHPYNHHHHHRADNNYAHHQHQHQHLYAPASSAPPLHHRHHNGGAHSSQASYAHDQHQAAAPRASDSRAVNEYLKRVQFSDSDRDKLMASYLTCDGLLNDNDHCLERLSCEFSDPQNIEKANKLDRAVSSILLGHILINTYIPNSFKLRLKSASLFGYTQSGKCSKFACSKLTTTNTKSAQQATNNE